MVRPYVFFKRLNTYLHEINTDNVQPELTVMGHSMGGIIINRALRDLPQLPADNIVYMASADTLQNYLDATVPLVSVCPSKSNCVI